MQKRVILVPSLNPDDIAGLEGCYVKAPKYKYPIYIPKRNADGVPILPADWYDDYDYEKDFMETERKDLTNG